ncbi:MAG: hypothetical protein OXI69_17790 [Acidobacteriota bacterium]|nr:hypothetical protein [Acidobacteriota bacterium]
MKPYLYILIVLSVGGIIGFFVGRELVVAPPRVETPVETTQADSEAILQILERQVEAYRLRDALLLMRDCEESFVEIDGNSGRSYSLAQALVLYHELFQPEQGIRLRLGQPEVTITHNSAVVRSRYVKTSDRYADQGIESVTGDGQWLLTKVGNIWQITVFFRTETIQP